MKARPLFDQPVAISRMSECANCLNAAGRLTVVSLGKHVFRRVHVVTTSDRQQGDDDDQGHPDVNEHESLSQEREVSGLQRAMRL